MSGDGKQRFDECVEVTPECPVKGTIYGYTPNLGVNAFFCAYFAIFTLVNLVLTIRFKSWFYGILMVLGALGEALGYVGRIMMHGNPWDSIGFQIQICTLIFSPSFLAAALYMTLKHIVRAVGPQFSVIKPKLYPYIFIACDIFSLVLQAIGGGVASSANDEKTTDMGGHIMLAGIIFQVVTFTALYVLIALYLVKLQRNISTLTTEASTLIQGKNFKIFALGMLVASLFIFIRCVYRIAELAGGWANEIMRDEVGYIVLDGVMCCLATLVMTVCHPGFFFKSMLQPKKQLDEKNSEASDESVAV